MPYSPSTFVDQSTSVPISAAELNKIGTGMSKMAYGPDGTVGQVPAADGSGGFTWQKIGDAQVASNAAIGISKLASYPADATKYLRGDGTWASVTAGSELDYAQITTGSGSISATTEGTATAVITGNAVTYDGTKVYVEFWAPQVQTSGTSAVATLVLFRDSTALGHTFVHADSIFTGKDNVSFRIADTPSAGSHTYKISAFVNSGSCSVTAGAGGSGTNAPAFLRVVKA